MRKKSLLLVSAAGLCSLGLTLMLCLSNSNSLLPTIGTTPAWNHYEAVAPTCETYGIKEYWTNCQGTTTIVDPVAAEVVEKGQPSASDIQDIVDTYGAGDERIIAKSAHNYVADANCLGKEVCSVCSEVRGAVPSVDFATNGIYGMYDWYKSFGAPDPGWVFNVGTNSIHFYTYNAGVYSEVCLPRMYFVGFEAVTIELTVANASEKYSFESDLSTYYTIPSASYAARFVFSNISNSSMVATLRDSSDNILLSKVITDTDVLTGVEGFKFYDEGVGLGDESLANFTFIAEHVHDYDEDPNCIGKEICSVCYKEKGMATPSFDFTANLYGACDVYVPWGMAAQDGWVRADNAGQISFVNYTDGDLCIWHLPRIFFAGYSSLTIDITVNYNLVRYSLDSEFNTSYQVSFAGYPLKLVFDNISSSSMTVKILDAFSTVQVQATCTNLNVLNGNEGYVMYTKGSGNVGWDAFSNFTFVA